MFILQRGNNVTETVDPIASGSDNQLLLSPIKVKCMEKLDTIFNVETLQEPNKAFHSYITDFCETTDLEIPSRL